jgi:4'-phosphopantetheinyl transferase
MLYLNTKINEITEQQLDELIRLLPLQRREKAERFTHRQGRRECVLSYLELCRGLKEEFGITEQPDFDYTPKGKPFLSAHPHIHFSISHCRNAVGCLISTTPCGLDIERIRPLNPQLVRHTMNEEECHQIFSSSRPDVTFIRMWTQKEAVLKLNGTGITDHLHQVLLPQNLEGIHLSTTDYLEQGFVLTSAISYHKNKESL